MDILFRLLAVFALVLANGFFVAAEFSLVAIRRSRVEQLIAEGHPLASAVQRGVMHLDTYLAATQLGITMASIGLGWIGEPALAGLVEPAFQALPAQWAWIGTHTLAVAIAFAIITALHIVLGELAPKSLALQRTEGTALAVGKPLELFLILFRPAIWLLNGAGNWVLRLVGLNPATSEEMVHSVEELRYLVTASRQAGVLDSVESEMIDRAFLFGETRAHEVMVPRTEMVGIDVDTSLEEALEIISREGYSRVPIYQENLDNIVGILHLRDLVRAVRQKENLASSVRGIMRPALLLPESVSAEIILGEMRRRRTQMAILIDEYSGTAGLVTMEDLLEEIVGEVHDEFESPHEAVRPQPDGTVLIDGLLPIDEFKERFGLRLEDEEYDTVGGLIMDQLGRVAQLGDEVILEKYRLVVEAMDGRRVATVRLFKTKVDTEE
ncbi:MAG: HlyC/CorC family transporter [Chloroflexota bacterium]|nr:MAG: HlyC/CorC family transporter [Chloroflexota bacterium]